ncbi:MAG: type II toxin-antitoxin system RelE/ParE family toxin [Bacillota bacterium]
MLKRNEVVKYIARDSPAYAASFVLKVREVSRSLKMFARRGRVVPEPGLEYIRELFIYNYRLI